MGVGLPPHNESEGGLWLQCEQDSVPSALHFVLVLEFSLRTAADKILPLSDTNRSTSTTDGCHGCFNSMTETFPKPAQWRGECREEPDGFKETTVSVLCKCSARTAGTLPMLVSRQLPLACHQCCFSISLEDGSVCNYPTWGYEPPNLLFLISLDAPGKRVRCSAPQ